jgi:hypothetical protein
MGFVDGHLARAVFSAINGHNQVVNVIHYDMHDTSIPGSAHTSLQSLADHLRDACMTPYKSLFPSNWVIQPIVVQDEIDPQHPGAVRNGAVSGAPANGLMDVPTSGNALPFELCAVATIHTGHIGRRFRGRMFLPPLFSDDAITGQVVDGSKRLSYQNFLDSIPKQPDVVEGVDPIDTVTNWSVYSRTNRAQGVDPYATPVTSYEVRPSVRFLRSRGS